jgi:hypothetical protein
VSHEEALALKEELRKREGTGELAFDLVHPAGGTLFHGWIASQLQVSLTLAPHATGSSSRSVCPASISSPALKPKATIDDTACGGMCHRQHEIIQLQR